MIRNVISGLQSPAPEALAQGGVPMPCKDGYTCLYSRAITQSTADCVVGYFDKNGVLIREPLTDRNAGLVAYYRVLGDTDKATGWPTISSCYPSGKRRSSAVAIRPGPAMLETGDLAKLGGHGYLQQWYEDGKQARSGRYDQGKLVGEHREWYPSGIPSFVGNYSDNVFDGREVTYYENGNPKQDCHYQAGKMEGPCINWHENGRKSIEASYRFGQFAGEVTEWHANGKLKARGHYQNGVPEKLFTQWHENGKKAFEREFQKGGRTVETRWYPDGRRASVQVFERHLLQGESQAWYETGKQKELYTYDRGKKQGPFALWYSDGRKQASGSYVDDQIDGTMRSYMPDRTYIDMIYRNGELESIDDSGTP